MYILSGIILIVLICYCIKYSKFNKNLIFSMYGFIDLETIKDNKDILEKELDFINRGINGLSGLALTATSTILGSILIYKDKLLDKFIKDANIFIVIFLILILTMLIYIVIYSIEMYYKNNYKKEIIKKLNNNSKDAK